MRPNRMTVDCCIFPSLVMGGMTGLKKVRLLSKPLLGREWKMELVPVGLVRVGLVPVGKGFESVLLSKAILLMKAPILPSVLSPKTMPALQWDAVIFCAQWNHCGSSTVTR